MASKTVTLTAVELIQRQSKDPGRAVDTEAGVLLVPADPSATNTGATVRVHLPKFTDLADFEVGKNYRLTVEAVEA